MWKTFLTNQEREKIGKLTIFIYKQSKTINVTGVKSFDVLQLAHDSVCKFLKLVPVLTLDCVIVDSSTASFHLNQSLNLSHMYLYLIGERERALSVDEPIGISHFSRISYAPQRFSVLRLRTIELGVTLHVFSSGRVIILGAKREETVNEVSCLFTRVVSRFLSTSPSSH